MNNIRYYFLTLILFWGLQARGSSNDLVFSSTSTYVPEKCHESRKSMTGDMIFVHYTGYIHEKSKAGRKGSMFDSSVSREPFEFQLGAGHVIKGWDKGLLGMCIGEKRTLILPPEYAYGSKRAGSSIPGGATLKFDVECVDIRDKKVIKELGNNIFKEIDTDGDWLISQYELDVWFMESRGEADGAPPGLFNRDDLDGDGLLTWDEFAGPKGTQGPPDDL